MLHTCFVNLRCFVKQKDRHKHIFNRKFGDSEIFNRQLQAMTERADRLL